MSGLSFYSLTVIERAQTDLIFYHTEALIRVERLGLLSERKTAATRNFLLTGSLKYLEDISKIRAEFLQELANLESYIETSEGETFYSELKATEAKHFAAAETLIQRKRSGAPTDAIIRDLDAHVDPLLASLDQSLRAIVEHKQERFLGAKNRSLESITFAKKLLTLVTFLAVALGIVLTLLVLRTLSRLRQTDLSLREALQVRDEFLSIASHELKNPLTALSLQLQMIGRLIRELPASPTEEACRQIGKLNDRADEQTKRLKLLLEELLDLTRIRAGKLALHPTEMNLVALAEDVISRLKEVAASKGTVIRFEKSVSAVEGCWDSLRLEQVITNLLSNAIKYGEGTPITVRVESDGTAQRATLSVQDQGAGIPPDLQKKIFERFERATTTGKIKGLGLGLYIVRQIVEAHNGRVWVESAPKAGTTFFVQLPLSRGK